MKKRAFVRYSKQGKIVPGSLILTGGSYPQGPSTWKEVPADLCCEPTTVSITFTMCSILIGRDGTFEILVIPSVPPNTNIALALTVTDDVAMDYLVTVNIVSGNSSGFSIAEAFVGLGSTITSVVINSSTPAASSTQTYTLPGTYTGDCVPV